MSLMYKIIQGQNFRIRVYSQNSIIIIKDLKHIITFNNVTVENNGDMWLNVLIDNENYLPGGFKQFQLFEDNVLKQSGSLLIVVSLLVNSDQDLRGRYQIIVLAIEAALAGVASHGQKIVKVGDKLIQNYSSGLLLSLLSYFKGKLDEEKSGTSINTKTDQMVQKYVFRIR